MSNYLAKTPENFRAEIARWRIIQLDIAEIINMNPSDLSSYITGHRLMREWAANNIAWAINQLTGHMIFEVSSRGLIPAPIGKPPRARRFPVAPLNTDEHHRPPEPL